MLDRRSPLPLWAQLEDDLRARIARNEFAERFPTDEEMVRDYGVSRQTVREAVRRLEQAGVVVRERGRGSFLRRTPDVEQPVQALYSLAHSIAGQGLAERSSVLSFEQAHDARAAAALGLEPSAPLTFIERLRFAAEEPLALDRSWLPAAIGTKLTRDDLEHGSIYEAITRRAGLTVTGGRERIRATTSDQRTRQLLGLPRGEAILLIERLALAGAEAVEWRISALRGDRFSLTTEWR